MPNITYKFDKSINYIIHNNVYTDDVKINLINELTIQKEILDNVEPPAIPSNILKDLKHLDRFDLDYGGQSKTALRVDKLAIELHSQGLIQLDDLDSTIDIEQACQSLLTQSRELKEMLDNAYITINSFYLKNVFQPRIIFKHLRILVLRFLSFILAKITQILFNFIKSFKFRFKNISLHNNLYNVTHKCINHNYLYYLKILV
jgi:hypothetical protein